MGFIRMTVVQVIQQLLAMNDPLSMGFIRMTVVQVIQQLLAMNDPLSMGFIRMTVVQVIQQLLAMNGKSKNPEIAPPTSTRLDVSTADLQYMLRFQK
jgi:Fe2+ transport system protein FeoA